MLVGLEVDEKRMTTLFDHLPTWAVGFGLVAHFAVGAAVGSIYLQILWWNAQRLVSGGGIVATLASTLARFGLDGAALVLASRDGATALLLTAAGLLAARQVVLGRIKAIDR